MPLALVLIRNPGDINDIISSLVIPVGAISILRPPDGSFGTFFILKVRRFPMRAEKTFYSLKAK